MKLKLLTLSAVALLLSSCYGYGTSTQAAGTMIGASVGGHLGSIIGGHTGGFAGDVFGTVIGTVAGAAIGHAATAPEEERTVVVRRSGGSDSDAEYQGYDATTRQGSPSYRVQNTNSGNSVRRGSDILNNLEVKNLRFIDEGKNRIINSNETCQLLFEVQNNGTQTATNITPLVYEVNKMKHIYISNPAVIPQLKPGEYVTYTITIRSDSKLSDGTATFAIELSDENGLSVSCREFDITTAR